MNKPCIIIPFYNHPVKIQQVLATLDTYQLPCLIVDDGSDADSKKILASIDAQYDWVQLHTLAVNQGKGAAVCYALQQAYSKGYTHALQVDADGQHDLRDIPKFLSCAEQYPLAVVSGERVYSKVPKNRRYGRKVTDFWVHINTLSTHIKDSMCGYRLYPLDTTIKVLDKFSIGQRMDFDTDILVKLYWQGLSVEHIATDVIYDDEIISHFDLWQDNVRISLMHTRLFFGMLVRIPQLLKRRFS